MEKLSLEERELATGYILRHTLGAKFGAMLGGKKGRESPKGNP